MVGEIGIWTGGQLLIRPINSIQPNPTQSESDLVIQGRFGLAFLFLGCVRIHILTQLTNELAWVVPVLVN